MQAFVTVVCLRFQKLESENQCGIVKSAKYLTLGLCRTDTERNVKNSSFSNVLLLNSARKND